MRGGWADLDEVGQEVTLLLVEEKAEHPCRSSFLDFSCGREMGVLRAGCKSSRRRFYIAESIRYCRAQVTQACKPQLRGSETPRSLEARQIRKQK